MQPAYLPWAGYCQRILRSDVHIVLDSVKIGGHTKTQFINRNRVLAPNGSTWLTLPLSKQKSNSLQIKDIFLADTLGWKKKQYETLRHSYAKAGHYPPHDAFFKRFFNSTFTKMIDAITTSTQYLLDVLDCRKPTFFSSQLKVPGTKSELILNLCRAVGASEYISGPFGKDYLNLAAFEQAGIAVTFHDYVPVSYDQTMPGFVPYLSVVDMLFNLGAEQAHALLAME